jgi:hypothetical protein
MRLHHFSRKNLLNGPDTVGRYNDQCDPAPVNPRALQQLPVETDLPAARLAVSPEQHDDCHLAATNQTSNVVGWKLSILLERERRGGVDHTTRD